ncbi:hypothetical protein Bca101_082680 [Brassica carinata]
MALSMAGVHAVQHTGLWVSVRMRRSQVWRHLVLRHVKQHGYGSCTPIPPPCIDTQLVRG